MSGPWEDYGSDTAVEDGPWMDFQGSEPVEINEDIRNLPNQQLATRGGPPLSLPSGAAKSVLSEVGGEVGQFVENIHTPTFELAEPLTLEERNFLKSESKGTQRAAGVYESLANTANFFTSPMGIATLGIGFLPRTAQKVAAGLFAIQMGKAVPEIATQLGEELGKPESERDQTKIAELITTGATTTGFAYLTGRHALKPTPKAIKLAEEIDAAEFTPRESTPAPVRELGIPQASLTAEPFLQPGVRGVASDALREAQSPINVGQPALEALRREIQPPKIVPSMLAARETSVFPEVPPQPAPKSPLRTAENIRLAQTEAPTIKPPIERPPGTPLQDIGSLERDFFQRLKNRELVEAVDMLKSQPVEVSRKLVDEVNRVGEKPVDLSAAEKTIFNELWEKVYQDALAKGRPPETIQPTSPLTRTGELGQGGGVKPEATPQSLGVPPIISEMISTAQTAAAAMREKVSDVKPAKYVEGQKFDTITFNLQGKTYKAELKGRNRDLVLGASESADKAIALRAFLDGDAVEINPTPPTPLKAKEATALQPANEYVYHATSRGNAQKVRAEGLAPGSWFAKTPKEALAFAKDDPNAVVFAVKKSEIKLTEAAADDIFGQEFQKAGVFQRSSERHTPVGEVEKYGDGFRLNPVTTKIEGMGGAKTPVQTLNESRMVNVKVPEGATRIRVTDNRGRISVTTLDNVNKGANVFQRTDVAKIEAGIIGKDGKFKPVEGEVTVSERAPKTASEKLEALKFKADKQGRVIPDDPGQVFSLPHPDAIKQISKQLWNDSIDLAIKAIQTGKTVAQAIDAAVKKIAYNAKGFDEAKIRANLASVLQEEGRPKPKSVPTTPQTQATPTTPVQIPGTTTHPIKASIKSNLTAQRGLPDVAFDAWVKRQGTVQEQVNRTAHGVRELYRALADQYGIGFVRRAFKGLSDVPPADVRLMNDYLRGKADAPIPERLREPLDRLRAHIDALSNRMIQEGLVNDKLALTLDANLGSYLRRSYKVFDDPKWGLDKLTPESQQKVVNGMLEELRKTNPNATVQDALNNIEAVVNEYKRTGEQEIMFGKSRTIGGKDLSLFLKRKDLSDWWKTMMGEYETPVMNYAKSISKMARFVADQTFLKEVEKAGVGSFLFKEPTAGHTSRIAAEGNKALEPLSQYYTTPEIAKAFREFYDKPSEAHPVWRFIMGVTYASKGAKTVGSFLTQARNLLGQPFFWARNGHFDVREAMPAVKAVFADVAGKEGKWLEYYRDAIKHGVANESAQVGELRTVLKDVVGPRDADMPVDLLAGRSVWNMGKRVVLDPAERMYRTSDEIGKLVGWEIEKWYESRIHPEWTEAQVKAEAAKRVRNLYPTYSMISRMVKSAGKQPVLGPFMSFPAETIRTSYWAGKYALADLKSPNPYARMRGAKALVGMMAVYGGTFALASFFRQANNITKDQDDDVRRFMPDWSKNSQLLFTGPIKDGKADYINLSYINPYSYLTDPILAVAAGDDENYDERFWRAASEFVRPFTSEQMGAAAVMDLLRNQTESGRRVYNPEEETPQQIRDAAKHLLMPIVPGTIERAQKKIIPAALGEQPTTGQELSLKRELVSELTGIKSEGLDFQTAIARKLRTFAKAEKDVENIWVSRLFSGGKLPPEKIVSEYQRMNALRKEAWSELRQDSLAAIRLGVDDAKITTLLTGAGISNEQRRKIMAGDYEPYSPSVDLLKKALERHDIPEATFDGNTDGWLKLRQAKAEVAGNRIEAARAKKFISEIQSQRTLKTKVEKGNLEPDKKRETLARIDANISRLEALARERVQ